MRIVQLVHGIIGEPFSDTISNSVADLEGRCMLACHGS
jgi:hypothetical protein